MARAPKQIISRKHLARQERERIQTRYIMIATAAVFAVVVLLIGYGIVNEFILKPNQPAATVNNERISMREFQMMVRYSRQQIVNQYLETYQFSQLFGSDPNTLQYFQGQLTQISYQLEPTYLGQNVLDQLVDDRLIRAEAKALGITVTKEEVDRSLQEAFGYFPNGTPTPAPTNAVIPTSTLSPTQLALVPPTPTEVITQTIAITQTATPTTEPTAAPTSEPTLTPTAYTEEAFQKNFDETITGLDENLGVTESDLWRIYEGSLYRQKVLDAITIDLERVTDQVWARHILVADKETAELVLARLNAGEDFAALALELSTDTGSGQNGGDLGWFGTGAMVAPFETEAFKLGIGEISQPVESSFGWHIIQVLGHELRPLDDNAFENLRQEKFQSWLEEIRNEAEIDINEAWIENVPTEPNIPAEYLVNTQ